jgi:hypothetical protein
MGFIVLLRQWQNYNLYLIPQSKAVNLAKLFINFLNRKLLCGKIRYSALLHLECLSLFGGLLE